MRYLGLSVIFLAASVLPTLSHEFWIEPDQYQVKRGQEFSANLKNGEEFKGVSLGWFDRRFSRFEIVEGGEARAAQGRMGDTPALTATAQQDGLLIILHETTPSKLTYRDWDKFLKFVEHKDFQTAVSEHEARGWSKEVFRESYTRHVKTLMAVGDGTGSDRAFGLATEFVALTNPYASDFNNSMAVRVLYQGAPRTDAQVEVFEKNAAGDVTITLYRTDSKGEVQVPVTPGHAYLFDAVVLRPSADAGSEENAPVWETLWAALSFAVPE